MYFWVTGSVPTHRRPGPEGEPSTRPTPPSYPVPRFDRDKLGTGVTSGLVLFLFSESET